MTQECIHWKEGSGTRRTVLTCFGFIFSLYGQRYIDLLLSIVFCFQYLHPLSISLFTSKVINSFTSVHWEGEVPELFQFIAYNLMYLLLHVIVQ